MGDLQIKVSKKYPYLKYIVNFLDSLVFPQINLINLDITYLNTYNIIDKINNHLDRINAYYKCLTDCTKKDPINMSEKSTSITLYFLEVEELIYWMRKYIDIIIDMSYILNYIKINKKEPSKIKIDSIGKYLELKESQYKCFEEFLWLFNSINDVSNYYKHSIYNTNLNIIGKFEPCVSAFGFKNGEISIYNISLLELIKEFEQFTIQSKDILKNIK